MLAFRSLPAALAPTADGVESDEVVFIPVPVALVSFLICLLGATLASSVVADACVCNVVFSTAGTGSLAV